MLRKSLISIGILCLLSLGVLADHKDNILKEEFEFSRDVTVADTLVKKGRYLVEFNTDTGTVKFMDADQHSKVFAKAKAEVAMSDKAFDRDEILIKTEGDRVMLTGLRFGGQKEEIMIVGSAA